MRRTYVVPVQHDDELIVVIISADTERGDSLREDKWAPLMIRIHLWWENHISTVQSRVSVQQRIPKCVFHA